MVRAKLEMLACASLEHLVYPTTFAAPSTVATTQMRKYSRLSLASAIAASATQAIGERYSEYQNSVLSLGSTSFIPSASRDSNRHDDTLVLDVVDAQVPANHGRWRLAVADGTTTCERTDDDPDVTLDVDVLGSLYLGGVSAVALADARRLDASSDVVDRLDRMFRAARAPLSTFDF